MLIVYGSVCVLSSPFLWVLLCLWLCFGLWLPICVFGYVFVSMDLYLWLWFCCVCRLCIWFFGFVFVAMALYLRVWICICVHGSVFVSMALFMSMALYLCLWICICVYGPEYISVKKIFQNIRPERVFFDGRTLQNITEHYRTLQIILQIYTFVNIYPSTFYSLAFPVFFNKIQGYPPLTSRLERRPEIPKIGDTKVKLSLFTYK